MTDLGEWICPISNETQVKEMDDKAAAIKNMIIIVAGKYKAGIDIKFVDPPVEVIYSESLPSYYKAQQMLGRATYDLMVPQAHLFTIGVPGEDENSFRDRVS